MYDVRTYKMNRHIKIVDVRLKMIKDAGHIRIQNTNKIIFRAADVSTLLLIL